MADVNALQQGIECLKAQKLDEAITYFEQAADQNPSDFRTFSYLGIAYAQKKLNNRAIGAFQSALRLRSDIASIHYNLGLAYQADGLTDLARDEYHRALEIDPSYQKAEEALRYLGTRESTETETSCARHPDEPAVGECSFCRLPVCKACKVVVNDQVYCSWCSPNK